MAIVVPMYGAVYGTVPLHGSVALMKPRPSKLSEMPRYADHNTAHETELVELILAQKRVHERAHERVYEGVHERVDERSVREESMRECMRGVYERSVREESMRRVYERRV